jgi:hypothetical protein
VWGGEQFPDYEEDILDFYVSLLSAEYYRSQRFLFLRVKHLHALGRTLEAGIPSLPEEEQDIARGMTSWFDFHRDELGRSLSEDEIGVQLSQVKAPDSLEGIA